LALYLEKEILKNPDIYYNSILIVVNKNYIYCTLKDFEQCSFI
jgi:hypothetical protein